MYDNISNNVNTNIFETLTGALPLAPVKVSGSYKIFVNKNLELYLDDYNGRRVRIDLSKKFLPQVANFLKTNTIISDYNKLRYGAFRNNTELTYHCPIYINQKLPKYFSVLNVENKTFTDYTDLHRNNNILLLIDLDKIGISKIFNEILTNFDYIVNFNLEDSNLSINGYSIINETIKRKSISTINSQSNQTHLSSLNNKILNTFKEEQIIFPKFINIEFEFNYVNNLIPFNNFFGYFSNEKIIELNEFTPNITTVSLKNYNNKIEFKQESNINQIISIPFIDISFVSTLSQPNIKLPQLRIKINNITPNDYIKIYHPDNTIYFEYLILPNDIKSTLHETLRKICIKCTNLSNHNLIFESDVNTNIITIKSNIEDNLIELYYLEQLNNFILIDNTNKFCSIKETDIIINTNNDNIVFESVKINNQYYNVIKRFKFNNENIIRLENFNNLILGFDNVIEFYENKLSYLIQLIPIDYLSYNSTLSGIKQFDKQLYVNNLHELFNDTISTDSQQIFMNQNNFTDIEPYVDDENYVLTEKSEITENVTNNDINVLSMLFCSPGCTAMLVPNILNIDKRFYEYSTNLNYKLLDSDRIKFHWFLLKAQTPEYLSNDIRSLRYFTDKPKVTSRLIRGADNLDFCETIFLGVKYRLPQKYTNYQFATYLNFNQETDVELNYSFDVDELNKTIYLSINKYLDFIDLLRGCDINNEPLIDLSFFYCVKYSHNTTSESLFAFRTGGLLLCDTQISVMYQNTIIENDWKVFDELSQKWYICLKRSLSVITAPLTELFPETGDIDFYVYGSVLYQGQTHYYTSMKFTVKGIREVKPDYIWCEDINVKFFDTPQFFINIYNPNVINQIFQVNPENIISSVNTNNTEFGDNTTITTILQDSNEQQFSLINNDLLFSLKENYFELTRKHNYDVDGDETLLESYFYFPEYKHPTWTFTDLYNAFNFDSFDNVTVFSRISLFDRNQLWRIIQDILKYEIKFKHTTPTQTYNIIHEFLLAQLNEFSELKSIPIKNPEPLADEYVKISIIENDINVVIWKTYPEIINDNSFVETIPKLFKIQRYNSPYIPYLKLLNNELEFQSQISTNRNDVIFNIYDKDFNGIGINATGNLKEITGNIVSSLYTKNNDIIFSILYDDINNIDLISNLKNVITLEEGIINNKNENYISNINNNIDEYIKESYIKWLLDNTYKLDSIKNELGQKIQFDIISENIVKLKPKDFYNTRFQNAIFTFIRK